MSESFLDTCADAAQEILDEIATATAAYAAASGIRCRLGCGQCCLKPSIEATAVELLPLARSLLEAGEADAAYERAVADPDGRCVFYAPTSTADETLGRCSRYAGRPSVCRLFGYGAVSGRGAAPVLAACHWHKVLQPETIAAAQGQIDAGGTVPLFSEYSLRLSMIAPGSTLSERLPLNRALALAIEKLELTRR